MKSPMNFDARDDACMRWMARFVSTNGFPPSIREMMPGFGVASTSLVIYQLTRLEKKGLITRQHGKSRAIRINGGLDRWLHEPSPAST